VIHNILIGLHILAVIAWMAGLLYLPRLFAYHTRAAPGSQMDETFKIMEARLHAMIMRPALIAVLILGAALVWYDAEKLGWGLRFLLAPWMVTKLAGVAFLIGWHHFLADERRRIAARRSTRSERFWRMTNEAPFLAAIVVVLAATTKFA
jgi:putative membrane protein